MRKVVPSPLPDQPFISDAEDLGLALRAVRTRSEKWTPILGHWIEWTSALTVAVQGAEYHEQNTS